MKLDNSVNYILVIFCLALIMFSIVGSKMADNFVAMQHKIETTTNSIR